jgi:hypothetical protein
MLNTQQEIAKIGFNNFVAKYNLIAKPHSTIQNLWCLVYDQLKTPKNKFTNECRSLVIDKITNKVVSYPFYRFGELEAVDFGKIDFANSIFTEKIDGSLIHVYLYNGIMYAASKSMANAIGGIRNFDKNVSEYFFDNIKISKEDVEGKTLIFEFKHPYSFLTQSKEVSITKIGERCLKTMKETPIEYKDAKKFKNAKELQDYIYNLDPTVSEGLICVTNKFDEFGNIVRYKIKSPQFELISQLRCNDAKTPEAQSTDDQLNKKWLIEIRKYNEHKTFLQIEKYAKFADYYKKIDKQMKMFVADLESADKQLGSCKTIQDVLKLDEKVSQYAIQKFKNLVNNPQEYIYKQNHKNLLNFLNKY